MSFVHSLCQCTVRIRKHQKCYFGKNKRNWCSFCNQRYSYLFQGQRSRPHKPRPSFYAQRIYFEKYISFFRLTSNRYRQLGLSTISAGWGNGSPKVTDRWFDKGKRLLAALQGNPGPWKGHYLTLLKSLWVSMNSEKTLHAGQVIPNYVLYSMLIARAVQLTFNKDKLNPCKKVFYNSAIVANDNLVGFHNSFILRSSNFLRLFFLILQIES